MGTITPNILNTYSDVLARSTLLSPNTRRTYRAAVVAYLDWLAATDVDGEPLTDPIAATHAVRDYARHLQTVKRRKPSTINVALSAVVHLYSTRSVAPINVKRLDIPDGAPRALGEDDQRRFLRAVERCPSTRDRALATLLFYAGLRVSEVVGLDLPDIELTQRRGQITVRSGKGGRYREVPLHPEARKVLVAWLTERPAVGDAVFPGRSGGRLTTRTVERVIHRLAHDANLDGVDRPALTPHVHRHGFGTRLVRQGKDMALVADLMGHASMETTRRYAKPSRDDKAHALDCLVVDA